MKHWHTEHIKIVRSHLQYPQDLTYYLYNCFLNQIKEKSQKLHYLNVQNSPAIFGQRKIASERRKIILQVINEKPGLERTEILYALNKKGYENLKSQAHTNVIQGDIKRLELINLIINNNGRYYLRYMT